MIVDFSKQLGGLVVLIVEEIDKDSPSGDLLIFRIDPATILSVFTLMRGAFGCFTAAWRKEDLSFHSLILQFWSYHITTCNDYFQAFIL